MTQAPEHWRQRTKIVATIGPATDGPGKLEALIRAGVDVARINFSHGSAAEHRARVDRIRATARSLGRPVGILGDLQGPKIRIEKFADGPVSLDEGERFTLDPELSEDAGSASQVGISYPTLPDEVAEGDILLLNDGAIRLVVEAIDGRRVVCRVQLGGQLSDRKGINRLGGGLAAAALTDKDRGDIRLAAELGVNFLAVSFPRSAQDMDDARQLCEAADSRAHLIAKIERSEAIDDLEALIRASDGVMVARGDLGVEIGDAALPAVQKRIIATARDLNRVVITATQMMESMIQHPIPTRAEVLDVANAVMDGTDAVMLSAETAAGRHPVKAVEAMCRVCIGAEAQPAPARSSDEADSHFKRVDEAIAMATMYTASRMKAAAIASMTESGTTALLMSRQSTQIPIYALTRHPNTLEAVTLCRGVYPILFDVHDLGSSLTPAREAVACLQALGVVEAGQRVLVTKGDFTGPGGTNTMKIAQVPDPETSD